MTAWKSVRLGDLGTWYGGGTPSKSRPDFWDAGTIPWLSPKDMRGDVLQSTLDKITHAAVEGSAVRLIEPDSIAVVVRSGILERTLPVALVPFATTLNQDMKALACGPEVDPRWVAWGLRANEDHLLRTTRKAGTTVASIEWPRFLNSELLVPPVDEQRRIVDILEDHLSRLDAADGLLSNATRRAVALQATSAAAAVEAAGLDTQAAVMPLASLAHIGTGATPRRGHPPFWSGGSIPWVTSGELAQGLITEATQYVTETALAETSVKIWPIGALLVAMYGEGKTRGTVGELAIPATTNQACAAIVLEDDDPTSRAWLRLVLDSRYDAMRRSASGGVQPNLNLGYFREMSVPWPSRDRMRDAVDGQRDLAARVSELRTATEQGRRRSDTLRRALLQAAFSGRLAGRASDTDIAEELVS